jgi:hypothetical protein
MKHLTDQERILLNIIADSIQEIIDANTGILKALEAHGNSAVVNAAIPYTEQIGDTLRGMLRTLEKYAQVNELDIVS